jgi:uncharacterized tellurite resistance protein B-like protein
MRTYPTDSPQAAARIAALTLVADGNVSKVEMDVFDRADACATLGLDRDELHSVIQELCEDLLQERKLHWSDACEIDAHALGQLMAEVESPALRAAVLQLCVAIAEADGHVADGETLVLVAAVEQWGLQQQMFRGTAAG